MKFRSLLWQERVEWALGSVDLKEYVKDISAQQVFAVYNTGKDNNLSDYFQSHLLTNHSQDPFIWSFYKEKLLKKVSFTILFKIGKTNSPLCQWWWSRK